MKREIKRSGSTDFEHNFRSLHAVVEVILSSLPWIFLIIYGAICLAVTILCGY